MRDLPCHFKYSQQANATQHTNTERDFNVVIQRDLTNAAKHDKAVESVEHGEKITAQTKRIHFDQHFKRKQHHKEYVDKYFWKRKIISKFINQNSKKHKTKHTLKFFHPLGLSVVFTGQYNSVYEHKHNHQPVEEL